MNFKIAFSAYAERESHYYYTPLTEDWEKANNVCNLLSMFNLATHVIFGSEYSTSNIYLAEIWKVKLVLDNVTEENDLFMREMVAPMKVKFDKY